MRGERNKLLKNLQKLTRQLRGNSLGGMKFQRKKKIVNGKEGS